MWRFYIKSKLLWSEKCVRSNIYRMSGDKIPKEFRIGLSQFMRRMKRTIAYQKSMKGESLDEGKKSMSYGVYKKLYKLIFQVEGGTMHYITFFSH